MILFVCSQGRIRSHTARNFAIKGGLDAEACGTDRSAKITLTDNLLRCADLVFCMEYSHKKKVMQFAHADESKVFVFGIEDVYNVYDDELVFTLSNRLKALGFDDISEAIMKGFMK